MEGAGEGECPLAQSACCRTTEENLRVELEGRMVGLEMKVEQQTREYLDTISALKECIIIRDEKLEVLEEQLSTKDSIIQQLSAEMKKSEEKVAKLMETVEGLIKKLEENKNLPSECKDCLACGGNTTRPQPKKSKPKKTQYSRVTMESIFQSEQFSKFFTITVSKDHKREMCPFKTKEALCSAIGGHPVSITSGGKDGFMIQVANKQQSDKIKELKEINGQACKVTESEFFNETKGLFYLRNVEIEDFTSFREGLVQEYQLKDVIEANWIKTKKEKHKAYIISTYQESLPPYLRILGENSLAQVYPYRDLPMMCKMCQGYGHSKKRCSANSPVCGKCAQNHPTENCQSETFLCHNCNGNHPAGHKSCPVRQEEDRILELQKTMKIGRGAARRVLNGESPDEEVNINNNEEYCSYVSVNLEAPVTKICPFKLEHFFKTKFDIGRDNLRMGKNKFIIKCTNGHQYNKALKMKTVLNVPCSATPHKFYNESKGLIYLKEYNINDFDAFVAGLANTFRVTEAVHAQWIKPKDSNCQPVLLTFDRSSPPSAIEIPGAQSIVKVYDYVPRPLSCKNCLEYSHSKKNCENPARCKKCSQPHSLDKCTNPSELCFHCKGEHQAITRQCPKEKQQQEIRTIQHKEKISWPEAWQKYANRHPSTKASYAEKARTPIAKKTTNTPTAPASTPSTSSLPPPAPIQISVESKRARVSESSDDGEDRTLKKGKPSHQDFPPLITTTSSMETSETCENIRREAQQIFAEFKE